MTKRQVRMLEMEFFWTPAVGELIKDKFDNLHIRSSDIRDALLVQLYMFIICFSNRQRHLI